MSTVERTRTFLIRLRQEEAAARNARSTEARMAHQGLVIRLRRTIELIAGGPQADH